MIYKGYTIAAEERVYNLIEVDEDGTIGSVVLQDDCWGRHYAYRVVDADYNVIDSGTKSLDEAKAFIDELEGAA